MKEGGGISQSTYLQTPQKDTSVVLARGGRWVEAGKTEEMGASVIVSTVFKK